MMGSKRSRLHTVIGITSVRVDTFLRRRAPDEEGTPEGVVLVIFGLPEETEDSVEDSPDHLGVVEHRARHLMDQQPCDASLTHAERTVDKQDHLPAGNFIRRGYLAGAVRP